MIKYLTSIILLLFDYFHKKKIINFLKKSNINSVDIFFDVGAHKGESVQFFSNNLEIKKIFSFEASPKNFKILEKKYKDRKNLIIENIALSSSISEKNFHQCKESSSSTFSNINTNSNYLKKKMKYFNYSNSNIFFEKKKIKTNTLKNYMTTNNILKVDLIKMDTEGHEFEILKGLGENIKNINTIIFEHHYDNMLKKDYTFSNIHDFLIKNYFYKVFKIKMPFRKSFEYIYFNKINILI